MILSATISSADAITFVADREADIYDVLAKERGGNVHFVIRSKSDRRLGPGLKLGTFLSHAQEKFDYEIQIEGDVRKKCRSRKARLSVKYERVTLVKPKSCNDAHRVNTDQKVMQVILW